MLLKLENTHQDQVNKLLSFEKQNNLKLSLIDGNNNYCLSGNFLNEEEITQLIEISHKSGTTSTQGALPVSVKITKKIN